MSKHTPEGVRHVTRRTMGDLEASGESVLVRLVGGHPQMITQHARLLAHEVISKACQMYVDGTGPDDLAKCREAVLNIRWPVRGSGGVAQAHLRTQREVLAAITEFYAPDDHTPERLS